MDDCGSADNLLQQCLDHKYSAANVPHLSKMIISMIDLFKIEEKVINGFFMACLIVC